MRVSVARRTALAMSAVVLLVVTALTVVLLLEFRASITDVNRAGAEELGRGLSLEVRRRGELLTGYLARSLVDPLYRYDLETIRAAVVAARAQPDVQYVYVFDREGRIVHDGTQELALLDKMLGDEVSRRAVAADRLLVQETADVVDVSAPIVLGERRLGGVRVGLSLSRVRGDQESLAGHVSALGQRGLAQGLRSVALVASGMVLLGCLVAFAVSRALTRPLARLVSFTRRLGEGDYAPPPDRDRTDEIGELSSALHEATLRRQGAEDALTARNRELGEARDEAVTASRAKSVFLATMSHELRTPLNHVIGFAQMLGEELEDRPELAADAAKIETAAQSLLATVQAVLDLARIQSESLTVQLGKTDLAELVEGRAREAQPAIERRGNRLEVRLDPALRGARLITDRRAVERILGCLLDNAAKFTKDGAVTVDAAPDGDGFRVSVADTGVGIRADYLPRLFEPFSQADDSASRAFDGAGLGLAISHGLARLVGGDLAVTSEEGRGSVFTLRMPGTPGSAPRP